MKYVVKIIYRESFVYLLNCDEDITTYFDKAYRFENKELAFINLIYYIIHCPVTPHDWKVIEVFD